jgi:hypothetical protein
MAEAMAVSLGLIHPHLLETQLLCPPAAVVQGDTLATVATGLTTLMAVVGLIQNPQQVTAVAVAVAQVWLPLPEMIIAAVAVAALASSGKVLMVRQG